MSTYQALVLGATGAIGSVFLKQFENDPQSSLAVGLSRQKSPKSGLQFELENEESMAQCALALRNPSGPYGVCEFKWIIDATGALSLDNLGPEKRLEALNSKQLLRQFEVNAVGPALLMKHFFLCLCLKKRLATPRCLPVWAVLKTITRADGMVTAQLKRPETCCCKQRPLRLYEKDPWVCLLHCSRALSNLIYRLGLSLRKMP
jgi:hypothetical protein